MNRFQLYRLLSRNNKLGFRRSPVFEQSMVAKVMMWFGAAFTSIYLIMFGVMFSTLANDEDMPAFVLVLMPLLLLIDFGARFGMQQTPVMLVKPYLLLPVPKHAVIENFLLSSVFSGWNWLWLCLFLPYAYITWMGGADAGAVLCVLVSGMLLVMANSQWYLIIRTLVARNLLWWLLPAVVYVVYFVPMILDDDLKLFSKVADAVGYHGAAWWVVLLCLLWLVALFLVSRSMQFRFVFEEISKEQKAPASLKSVSQFTWLERFGQAGEYLKLEVKSILRNKAIRSRVIMSLALVIVLSLLIAFTDIYDGFFMLNFWCYYCFGIYGMTTLVKVMSPEGNYIDLLMVHRENILTLLKAKYYFHVAILVVPFIIMIPAMVTGKFSVLMMLAYLFLSSGLLYSMLFQLAVYNKQTLPLNEKITGKGNVENGLQLAIEMGAMFLPLLLVSVLLALLSETAAYVVMMLVGLVLTLCHPLWLRHIYKRMMKRKYDNLEGFHASR
jgi:hypothetical protein